MKDYVETTYEGVRADYRLLLVIDFTNSDDGQKRWVLAPESTVLYATTEFDHGIEAIVYDNMVNGSGKVVLTKLSLSDDFKTWLDSVVADRKR